MNKGRYPGRSRKRLHRSSPNVRRFCRENRRKNIRHDGRDLSRHPDEVVVVRRYGVAVLGAWGLQGLEGRNPQHLSPLRARETHRFRASVGDASVLIGIARKEAEEWRTDPEKRQVLDARPAKHAGVGMMTVHQFERDGSQPRYPGRRSARL
jgi:hypothetical protein